MPDSNENIPPELKALLEQKRAEILVSNHAPVADFAGLSPAHMYALINFPVDSAEPPIKQQLATPEMVETSIMCGAMLTALNFFASDKGEKLTPQGRWPRKVLLQIYELGDGDERGYDRPPRLEEDWPIANALHAILVHGKLLRKAKGRMYVTKQGRNFLNVTAATAYEWIQTEFTEHFNWAYLDGYPDIVRYQQHWGFMIWLLLRFGGQERPVSFYSEAFIKAWPMFLDELPEDSLSLSAEERFKSVFRIRYVQRWLAWMGWIEYRYEGRGFDSEIMLKATPVFYQRWATFA
ncbi:MAG: hypothetical protein V7744_06300 [Pseudomonadales bacterium]